MARSALKPAQIGELEAGWNHALQQLIPDWLCERPRELALDLHDQPYYGQSDRDDPDNWVCRGQARAGTTHFYRCATAYVMLHDTRFTLALVFVKPGDALVSIVERLLALVARYGVHIRSSHTFHSDEQGVLTVSIAAARVYTRRHARRKAGWCLYHLYSTLHLRRSRSARQSGRCCQGRWCPPR